MAAAQAQPKYQLRAYVPRLVVSAPAPAPEPCTGADCQQTTTASLAPASVAFSGVDLGTTASRFVRLTNTGQASLSFVRAPYLTANTAAAYQLRGNCGAGLAPGASCEAEVRFAPTVRTPVTGQVVFETNASNGILSAGLTGSGLESAVELVPDARNFTDVPVGESRARTFTYRNTGNKPLTDVQASLDSEDDDLQLTASCSSEGAVTLAAGASCAMTVTFTPQTIKALKPARLNVSSSTPGMSRQVDLAGNSKALPILHLPFDADFGQFTAVGVAPVISATARVGGGSAEFTDTARLTSKRPELAFGTKSFTIEAWFWTATASATPGTSIISYGNGSASAYSGWRLGLDGGRIVFVYNGTTITSSVFPKSAWNHVAVSREGTTLRIFLNGAEVTSATVTANLTDGVTASGHTVNIGQGRFNSSAMGRFIGFIDDLKVYNGVSKYNASFTAGTTP